MTTPPSKTVALAKHRYILAEYGDIDYRIKVYTAMRTVPMLGMKQPIPAGGIMGWETVISVWYRGRAAHNYKYDIDIDGRKITGYTDHEGIATIRYIEPDIKCCCNPDHQRCELAGTGTITISKEPLSLASLEPETRTDITTA